MGMLQKNFDDAFLKGVLDQVFEHLWNHISAQGVELDEEQKRVLRSHLESCPLDEDFALPMRVEQKPMSINLEDFDLEAKIGPTFEKIQTLLRELQEENVPAMLQRLKEDWPAQAGHQRSAAS